MGKAKAQPHQTQLIPDETGTIYLHGQEGLAAEYTTKDRFAKMLTDEVGGLKRSLRDIALDAISKAAEGASRVFMPNGLGGGVSVSQPDYSKEGNRKSISGDTLKEIAKLGGVERLGIPEEQLFESTSVPGSNTIVLSGRWFEWFKTNMLDTGKVDPGADPDVKVDTVEASTVRRLAFPALIRLKVLSLMAEDKTVSKIASLLLSAGLKEPMVKAEEK